MRRIHTRVTGVDAATGKPYSASDPALLLWVHVALVDSNLAARSLFGTSLPPADADRYVAEMIVAAELVGVPRDMVPASVSELATYIESVRPELACTPTASGVDGVPAQSPGLDEDIAEIWRDIRDGASVRCQGGQLRCTGTSVSR